MADCQNCDSTGLCPRCQGRKCKTCHFVGQCVDCLGGQRPVAHVEARRTGKTQFVVLVGNRWNAKDADDVRFHNTGRGWRPYLGGVAWPPRWTYRRA